MQSCSRRLSSRSSLAALCVLGTAAPRAFGGDLAPITDNRYNLELVFSPVLASGRDTALAGATVALTDGVGGAERSAASPAMRAHSQRDWFAWDADASISFPGLLSDSGDVLNAGGRAARESSLAAQGWVHASAGVNLQFGAFGLTHSTQWDSFSVQRGEARLLVNFGRHSELVAYSLMRGQLILGAGVRILAASVLSVDGASTLLSLGGAAPEIGATWMPTNQPYRLSATARAPIALNIDLGARSGNVAESKSLILPEGIRQPWEVDFGMAYQLGPHPMNIGWDNPHDGPVTPIDPAKLARTHATMMLSVRVLGSNAEAVSVLGFAEQVKDGSASVTFAPHLALETEPWSNVVKIRTGTYLEPARLLGSTPRPHFTAGLETRLAYIDIFSFLKGFDLGLQAYIDTAPRYTNIGGFFTVWK